MVKVKDKKFVLLFFLQMWVITTFMQYYFVMQYQSILFRDVDQFLPANATCVSSARKTTGTRRHRRVSYTNTYRYEVQGTTYTKILSGEKRKGKDRVIYYNPTDPEIISYYSNYKDAALGESVKIILAVIGQSVILFFVVKSIRGQKTYQKESAGVVLGDDFSFNMNDKDDSFMDKMYSSAREESEEIVSIPFRRSGEKQEVEEVETIAFTTDNNKPAGDFVLYTEEEYKQLQKDAK